MTTIRAEDATTLFVTLVRKLFAVGVEYRRGGTLMREFPEPVCAVLQDPTRNLVLHPNRMINPWVTLAEFPWMIAGRDDIAWLLPYLPRATDFSDDGKTWRAAYGPRLRGTGGCDAGCSLPVDQLAYVVEQLTASASTRRAVLTLWHPEADVEPGSADYPCTNWMQFLVNPYTAELDMHVVMRSNDVWWGWSGVNVTNFTLLHQLIAGVTRIPLGEYRHVSSNLHLYPRHTDAARRLAEDDEPVPGPDVPGLRHEGSLEDFTESCRNALGWVRGNRERDWRQAGGYTRQEVGDAIGLDADNWLTHWAHFMDRHRALAHVRELETERILMDVTYMDWRLAAIRWISWLRKRGT